MEINQVDAGTNSGLNPAQTFHASVNRLRAEVAEIARRSAEIVAQSSQQAALFDALCDLDGVFREAQRSWAETLATAGRSTATAFLGTVDVYAGWQARWLDAVETAWGLRGNMNGQMLGTASGTQQLVRVNANLALALDLRYGANANLVQIARYVGRSVASVQTDIAGFEQTVLFAAAFNAAKRQVPHSWDLRDGSRNHEMAGILRPQERLAGLREIELLVVGDWGVENTLVGRPRLTPPLSLHAERIWVIVVPAGLRVRFIPERRVEVEIRSKRPGIADILFEARYEADDVLQDAVNWILDRRRTSSAEVQRA